MGSDVLEVWKSYSFQRFSDLLLQLLNAMVAKLGNREDPLPQDSFEGVDEDEWVSEWQVRPASPTSSTSLPRTQQHTHPPFPDPLNSLPLLGLSPQD